MTPPIQAPNQVSGSSTPAQSPEVQAAQERYRQAGFDRNRAELTHKQAVKDHGADSAEAQSTKAELDKAQSAVEARGKELNDALKIKPTAPKTPGKTPAPTTSKPAEEPSKPPSSAVIHTFVKEYSESSRIIKFHFTDPKEFRKRIDKILKEIEKTPDKSLLEQLRKPHGEESFRVFEVQPKKVPNS